MFKFLFTFILFQIFTYLVFSIISGLNIYVDYSHNFLEKKMKFGNMTFLNGPSDSQKTQTFEMYLHVL